jgi:zinc protease
MDWFPRSALETIFELEADRLMNLSIDPDVVESERSTVYSERRQAYEDNNEGMLFEQMFANAYLAHPYQNPVIGWPSDIENWTQEDLEAFFKTYYAPNNLTMILVGDVTPEEVYLLADQYFSPIPRQHPPPEITIVEPEQAGERRFLIETETAAPTPLLHVAFHAGATADPETLHMDLLLAILAEGGASRLHRVLVEEEQLALSVGGLQSDGFDPGLVYFYLTLPPGGDVAAVEERLYAELSRVATEGVTDAELEKARNLRLASFWRSLQTIDGKASALGNFEVFTGDHENLFAVPERLAATTPDQLRAAAAKVFRRNNMTTGILQGPPEDEAE